MGKRKRGREVVTLKDWVVRLWLPVVRSHPHVAVVKLNDHHTYLSVGSTPLAPGDLVRFGISHPCTAFDKWRDIPVVDDEYRVVDVLHTYF